MLPDESSAGLAMAAGLAAAMAGAEGPRYVEAPDGRASSSSSDRTSRMTKDAMSPASCSPDASPSTATCSSTDEANPWKAASRRCSTVRATR